MLRGGSVGASLGGLWLLLCSQLEVRQVYWGTWGGAVYVLQARVGTGPPLR